MKGNGESELLALAAQLIDAVYNAACGDSNVSRSDIEIVVCVQHFQGIKHFVVIEKWLSLPHDHYIAHAGVEVFLHRYYLLNQFRGSEVAREALSPRSAESARHRAAHLRGDAHGKTLDCAGLVEDRHSDRFYQRSVRKLKHILSCSVS